LSIGHAHDLECFVVHIKLFIEHRKKEILICRQNNCGFGKNQDKISSFLQVFHFSLSQDELMIEEPYTKLM